MAGSLSSVAFSPNGQVLAVGGSGSSQSGSQPKDTTYLLNAVSGDRIGELSPGGGAEAFSPDGAMLATAGGPHDSITYLWGVHSGSMFTTLDDHHGSTVRSVSFSPSGRIVAADDKNGVVYLWRLHGAPGAPTASKPGSVSPPGGPNVNAVAFSPRGTILALGGNDGQAYLFDTGTESTTRTLSTPDNSAVSSVAFSSSGALLAASKMDGTTYVWDLDTHHRISLVDPDDAIIESVAFSPNGSGWPPVTLTATPTCGIWPQKGPRSSQPRSCPTRRTAPPPGPGTRSFRWRSARTTTRSLPPTRTAMSTWGVR